MTPTKRGLSRQVEQIEGAEDEQTPAEWAAEFADRRIADADTFDVVDAEDVEAESDEVLITTGENDHYSIEFYALREEIPDRFDVAEDFPA